MYRTNAATLALTLAIALSGALSGTLTGCETTPTSGAGGSTRTGLWWQCPPIKATTGLENGKTCVAHTDCMYGYCFTGGFLTGYNNAIKFCTKNNNCTGGDSPTSAACATDSEFSSAFEKSTSSGNTARTSPEPYKVCGRNCSSDAVCAAWNPEMPHCIKNSTDYVSLGTAVCGVNPFK